MVERSRFAEYLWRHGIKQTELAARSGISRQPISNAYAGRPVSLDVWIRLANALNVSVAEIAPAEAAALIAAVA